MVQWITYTNNRSAPDPCIVVSNAPTNRRITFSICPFILHSAHPKTVIGKFPLIVSTASLGLFNTRGKSRHLYGSLMDSRRWKEGQFFAITIKYLGSKINFNLPKDSHLSTLHFWLFFFWLAKIVGAKIFSFVDPQTVSPIATHKSHSRILKIHKLLYLLKHHWKSTTLKLLCSATRLSFTLSEDK